MKIYKVYAQCCRGVKGITEIDLPKAKDLIIETVFDMLNNNDISINVDYDDDEAVNKAYDELLDKALEYFEENDYFFCGDFEVIRSDEEPTRAGSYGWTREFI